MIIRLFTFPQIDCGAFESTYDYVNRTSIEDAASWRISLQAFTDLISKIQLLHAICNSISTRMWSMEWIPQRACFAGVASTDNGKKPQLTFTSALDSRPRRTFAAGKGQWSRACRGNQSKSNLTSIDHVVLMISVVFPSQHRSINHRNNFPTCAVRPAKHRSDVSIAEVLRIYSQEFLRTRQGRREVE